MDYLILIGGSYLLGSIPFGIIIGWLTRKQDLREIGTHNAGASNTFLVIGPLAGGLTAFLDIAKGFLPAFFAWVFFKSEALVGLAGLAAVCGHIWPVFFHFKGGKGVATASGVLIFISWKMFFLSLCIWALIVVAWRYVTMSNVVIFLIMPLLCILFNLSLEYIIFSILLSLVIIVAHRKNIVRYFQGEEPTLQELLTKKE